MEENKQFNKGNVTLVNVTEEEESSFDWRNLYSMFILNWQWIVLSIIIFLCGAFIYLRYKSPVYQVSAKMLVKDNENNTYRGSGSQMLSNMQDFGFITNSNGIDNEIEILQSHILAEKAVKDLKLYVEYKKEGRIKSRLIYKSQPVSVDIDPTSLDKMDETMLPIKMKIVKEGKTYKVEGIACRQNTNNENAELEEVPFNTTISVLPASVNTAAGTLTFTKNIDPKVRNMSNGKTLEVTIFPPSFIAARYISALSVEPTSKTTSIALLTLSDKIANRGEDFLKQLVSCYNEQANADKNEIAMKTEEFINDRLGKINAELGMTESELESYKKRNNLTQLKLDATETLAQTSQYSTKLSEVKSQIELLDYLREYINNPKNKYQIIPSNVGLVDQSSTTLINSFNQAVLDRNRLLRSASELSPQVATLTSTLDELKNSIQTALIQARRSADIRRQGIENQYNQYKDRVSNTPEQERILTQIGRQQEVKSGLYLMLLQKREENSISLAATADKGKLIDKPSYGGKVSPKGSVIMLIAFVLGAGLPLLIIYLLKLLRYKIEGHDDVAKLTQLPIVADVAVASDSVKSAAGIVVHENKNDQIDEIFRSMRTNIQFMLNDEQKVILFTSTTSGEGKTFNAANLAMSFALLGKKVILVGLDIRKPALGRLFGLSDLKSGVTPLLSHSHIDDETIAKQIQSSGINDNLDLMLAGPIPPNPTELLSHDNLGIIINYLKRNYDYVVLDTAPVGLVTDTYQVGKYADVCAFVCRADYTPRASFELINSLAQEKKMPNMCIVLNGVDMSKKKYSYYYGYGKYGRYGYYSHYGKYSNYGYGKYAGSHYGTEQDNSIKK